MASRRRDWLALLFALGFPTVLTLVYFVLLAGSRWQQPAYAAGKLIQFVFPVGWVVLARGERLRFHRPAARQLAFGAALGIVLFAGLLVLYHALEPTGVLAGMAGQVQAKLDELGARSFPAFLALAVFYSLIHSGLEEYYWRWFVFGELRRLGSFATALAVSSLGFMAHHVVILSIFFGWSGTGLVLTVLTSAAVGIGGAIWAWLYDRTGSLYATWLSHAFIDAAIFVVGYELTR